DQVDDQPVEEEAEVGHAGTHVPANEAVGAVAADDPAGADLAPLAVAPGNDEGDLGVVGAEVDDLDAALHLDGGERACPRVERPLELGLREHVGLRPAGETRASRTDDEKRLAGGVPPLVDVRGLGEARDVPAQPGGLEDAGDLVVEVNRAGERIGRGLLLEHADAPTPLAEQDGERLSDGAVADDRDVEPIVHVTPAGRSRSARTTAGRPLAPATPP